MATNKRQEHGARGTRERERGRGGVGGAWYFTIEECENSEHAWQPTAARPVWSRTVLEAVLYHGTKAGRGHVRRQAQHGPSHGFRYNEVGTPAAAHHISGYNYKKCAYPPPKKNAPLTDDKQRAASSIGEMCDTTRHDTYVDNCSVAHGSSAVGSTTARPPNHQRTSRSDVNTEWGHENNASDSVRPNLARREPGSVRRASVGSTGPAASLQVVTAKGPRSASTKTHLRVVAVVVVCDQRCEGTRDIQRGPRTAGTAAESPPTTERTQR